MANLAYIAESDVQVVWQTGKIYYKEMMERLAGKQPKNLQAMEFLTDMDLAYRAADLVISRAGAGTISELCLLGKPSVLMPSPNVAEDHQTKNAMALVENHAAVMVKDADGPEKLFKEAFSLVKDKRRLAALAGNSRKLAKPNATADIVKVILEEVKRK
jgi:UDP-N-acetylglucosamine--N-acetylmuramyl-(pentapeptide) pyrophosphoryl-undecaprenol N-acetylglucosamine transferase